VITLREEPGTGTIALSVQDHEIGISVGQQGQIFGRFMRADNAVAWGISGTGLGLYICRELVERHGGLLWFESEEGKGSTFFLALPVFSHVAAPEGDAEEGVK
jgi:signal transduction histidine kinase